MIVWLAEFAGRIKPLADIDSPQLLAMMEPFQSFLVDRLSPMSDRFEIADVEIVFNWNGAGVMGFDIRGEPGDVEEAKRLIGPQAEFRHLQS